MKILYNWKLAETWASQHLLDSPTFPLFLTIFHCSSLYIPNLLNFFSLFACSGNFLKLGPFYTLSSSKIEKFIQMKTSWNLCFSANTQNSPLLFLCLSYIYIFFKWFLLLFHCFQLFFTVYLYLFVISLISIPYCQHSGKFFEKRIFIYLPSWAQKLKNLYEWKIFENRTFA